MKTNLSRKIRFTRFSICAGVLLTFSAYSTPFDQTSNTDVLMNEAMNGEESEDDCTFTYFVASDNFIGGSAIFTFTSVENSVADLSLFMSLPYRVNLAFDDENSLLYLVHRGGKAYQTIDFNEATPSLSEPVPTGFTAPGAVTGAAYRDGSLFISGNLNFIYEYNLQDGELTGLYPNFNFGDNLNNESDIYLGNDGILRAALSSARCWWREGFDEPFGIPFGGHTGYAPEGISGLARKDGSGFYAIVNGRNRLYETTIVFPFTPELYLFYNGNPFTVSRGDMASGCVSNLPNGIVSSAGIETLNQLTLEISPNPTEGTSFATFSSDKELPSTLEVYDTSGRRVASLYNGTMNANVEYRAEFDGSQLPNGVYFYRYTSGSQVKIKKLIISR